MPLLEQIRGLAATLTLRQKIVIAATTLSVFAGLLWLVQWQQERDYAVLYANLSPDDAAAVVSKLKESATEYRLSPDSATVKVKAAKRPELHLQMASAGLPKTGRIGFEIFDRTNLAMTDFLQDVNLRRALEGEIERTLATIAEVETVRIHITPSKASLYLNHDLSAKAGVALKLRAERHLAPKNIQAITQLVSTAVEGLAPDAVTVIDNHGNLLSRQKKDGDEEDVNTARMEYRRNIERDLVAKVNSTLEPLLGPERFRAAVSVEIDYSTSDQSEEAYDPAKSVMTTSQRTEDTASTTQPTGVPGAPSALPRPTSRPGSAGAGGVVRRSENINFQTTRVVKRTHIPHGTVRRISGGVLLDHNVKWEGPADNLRMVVTPPSPEQLESTRNVLAAVVGLEPDRGDQLVVVSWPFEQTVARASPRPLVVAAPAPSGGSFTERLQSFTDRLRKKDPVALGIVGAAAGAMLVAIALMLLKRRRKAKGSVEVAKAIPSTDGAPGRLAASGRSAVGEFEDGDTDVEPRPGSELEKKLERHHRAAVAERARLEESQEKEILDGLGSIKLPSATTKKAEVLAKQLTAESKRHPDRFAQIVRTWVSDQE